MWAEGTTRIIPRLCLKALFSKQPTYYYADGQKCGYWRKNKLVAYTYKGIITVLHLLYCRSPMLILNNYLNTTTGALYDLIAATEKRCCETGYV